jgi:ribulose-5-phosphate 4-epimerase/fuculose-1-phosphate aldolase
MLSMKSNQNIENIKERVALACRIAYYEGLREDFGNEPSGHISVRDESTEGYLIMPGHLHGQGKGLRDITVDDVIVVDLDGKLVEGRHDPVEEIVIHTSIYKARPEIKSVLHLHPPAAVALASTDQTILPISIRSSYFAEGVPILERGPGIIDNEEIAEEMTKKLGNYNALIHKGHGIVTAGRNLEEACLLGIYLEGSARNQLMAKQFGGSLKPFDRQAAVEYARSHSLANRRNLWQYFENKWKDAKV